MKLSIVPTKKLSVKETCFYGCLPKWDHVEHKNIFSTIEQYSSFEISSTNQAMYFKFFLTLISDNCNDSSFEKYFRNLSNSNRICIRECDETRVL